MANEFKARNGLIAQNNSVITGSLIVTNGITGSLFGTASYASQALTASYLNTLNQDLTFNGNLTLNGTASVTYLNTTYESASVIYSSGSNVFGNNTTNTQTLIGTTKISGSLALTGSLSTTVAIGAQYGGTGFSSYTVGDILYADTTSTLAKLSDVAAGSYLRSNGVGAAPVWSTLILPNSATVNRVPYATSANTWGDSANLTYDGTTFTIGGSTTGNFIVNRSADGSTIIETRAGGSTRHVFSTAAVGAHAQILTGNSVDLRLGSTNPYLAINSNTRGFFGGTTTATAIIHIVGGTATANTAPLKFTAGTNLTTPEAGAMEFDGNNLYFTTGSTRNILLWNNNPASITGSLNISGGITGSLLGTASYASQALTASYALSSPGGGGTTILSGSNTTASFTNQSTWTFNHNIGNRFVIVKTVDNTYNELIPQTITLTNANTATITFSSNQSGYAIASLGGTSAVTATAVNYQSTPADPTGTTSTTGVMMGLAGAITPNKSGVVMVVISGDTANTNNTGGTQIQIRYGTGAAPTNAAALTGTAVGGLVKMNPSPSGGTKIPFSLNAIITGLTVSTAIWIDVSLASITSGTSTIKDISISAFEL